MPFTSPALSLQDFDHLVIIERNEGDPQSLLGILAGVADRCQWSLDACRFASGVALGPQ